MTHAEDKRKARRGFRFLIQAVQSWDNALLLSRRSFLRLTDESGFLVVSHLISTIAPRASGSRVQLTIQLGKMHMTYKSLTMRAPRC
jgi:hypothetical protein